MPTDERGAWACCLRRVEKSFPSGLSVKSPGPWADSRRCDRPPGIACRPGMREPSGPFLPLREKKTPSAFSRTKRCCYEDFFLSYGGVCVALFSIFSTLVSHRSTVLVGWWVARQPLHVFVALASQRNENIANPPPKFHQVLSCFFFSSVLAQSCAFRLPLL